MHERTELVFLLLLRCIMIEDWFKVDDILGEERRGCDIRSIGLGMSFCEYYR